MCKRLLSLGLFILLLNIIVMPSQAASPNQQLLLIQTKIEQFTGAKGMMGAKEDVSKVSEPRKDLSITVTGARLMPTMGLTSSKGLLPAPMKTKSETKESI